MNSTTPALEMDREVTATVTLAAGVRDTSSADVATTTAEPEFKPRHRTFRGMTGRPVYVQLHVPIVATPRTYRSPLSSTGIRSYHSPRHSSGGNGFWGTLSHLLGLGV